MFCYALLYACATAASGWAQHNILLCAMLCHAMLCLYVLCPPGVLESAARSAVMVQQHCVAVRARGQAELPTMPAQVPEGRGTHVSHTQLPQAGVDTLQRLWGSHTDVLLSGACPCPVIVMCRCGSSHCTACAQNAAMRDPRDLKKWVCCEWPSDLL